MDDLTMNGIIPTASKFAAIATLSALLLSSGIHAAPAGNDIQASSDLLKKCLDKHIAKHAAKKNPSKDAIIQTCKKEFNALQAKLPDSLKGALQQNVNTGVEQELKKAN